MASDATLHTALSMLFPFFISVDGAGVVQRVGPSLASFLGEASARGVHLSELFEGRSLEEEDTVGLSWSMAGWGPGDEENGQPCVVEGLNPGASIRLKGVWLHVSKELWIMTAQVLLDGPKALGQAGLAPNMLSRSDLSYDMHRLHEKHQVEVERLNKHIAMLESLMAPSMGAASLSPCLPGLSCPLLDGSHSSTPISGGMIANMSEALALQSSEQSMALFLAGGNPAQLGRRNVLMGNMLDPEVERSLMEMVNGRRAVALAFPEESIPEGQGMENEGSYLEDLMETMTILPSEGSQLGGPPMSPGFRSSSRFQGNCSGSSVLNVLMATGQDEEMDTLENALMPQVCEDPSSHAVRAQRSSCLPSPGQDQVDGYGSASHPPNVSEATRTTSTTSSRSPNSKWLAPFMFCFRPKSLHPSNNQDAMASLLSEGAQQQQQQQQSQDALSRARQETLAAPVVRSSGVGVPSRAAVAAGPLEQPACQDSAKASVPTAPPTSECPYLSASATEKSGRLEQRPPQEQEQDHSDRQHSTMHKQDPQKRHSRSFEVMQQSKKTPRFKDQALAELTLRLQQQQAQEQDRKFRSCKALVRTPSDKVLTLLAGKNSWTFDSFALDEATDHHPLSTLAFAVFKESGIIDCLHLDQSKLVSFLLRIEAGYNDNPYHSRVHAADVLRTLHVIITHGKVMSLFHNSSTNPQLPEIGPTGKTNNLPSTKEALTLLAVYLSAIMHDYDHRGVTNAFLIQDQDPLALLYNDSSPMENHHLAAAFAILYQDKNHFLSHLSRSVQDVFRSRVISLVLSTDMKQHFTTCSQFNSKLQECMAQVPSPPLAVSSSLSAAAPFTCPLNTLAGATPSALPSPHSQSFGRPYFYSSEVPISKKAPTLSGMLIDDELKVLIWKMVLKCSDLGHLSSEEAVHLKWVHQLEEEMFQQGDLEKQRDFSVSPLMDRCGAGITKSQSGFFNAIGLPLFTSLVGLLPAITPMLKQVQMNHLMWLSAEQANREHADNREAVGTL